LKAILIDSDILIEVSRARDAVILANWDDLSRSDVPLLCRLERSIRSAHLYPN
jgi:hypothetical protein